MTAYFLTAFTIGIMGSSHCVGMCGPLALAIPLNNHQKFYRLLGILNYFLGKTLTYGILGLFSGMLAKVINVAGFQQYLSIFAGVSILVILVFNRKKQSNTFLSKLNHRWLLTVKTYFGKFIHHKNLLSAFFIGLINGLLPCGLVYIALAGSIGAGGWWQSVLYMMLFGISSMPLLMLLMLFKYRLQATLGKYFNKTTQVFTVAIALLLIVRGLNLGIPYISPKQYTEQKNTNLECCVNPERGMK